ncbi:MAG: cupin [Gammaproteobacteria bacterium]|nr:cupin [Gammaproteobacteria bacterium]
MNGTNGAASLASTFAVMNRDFRIDCLPVSDSIYAELGERYDGFAGHLLIACHSFDGDRQTWENHPHGDELVSLVSGDAEFILRTDEGEQSIRCSSPGDFVVVPRNTWHTAKVHSPTSKIFVTPGEGTENRESPE